MLNFKKVFVLASAMLALGFTVPAHAQMELSPDQETPVQQSAYDLGYDFGLGDDPAIVDPDTSLNSQAGLADNSDFDSSYADFNSDFASSYANSNSDFASSYYADPNRYKGNPPKKNPIGNWNSAPSVLYSGECSSQHNLKGTSWPSTSQIGRFTYSDNGNYWPFEAVGFVIVAGTSTANYQLLSGSQSPPGNWYADCTVTRTESGRNVTTSGNNVSHYSCYGIVNISGGIPVLTCSVPYTAAEVKQSNAYSTWQGTVTVTIVWGAPYLK